MPPVFGLESVTEDDGSVHIRLRGELDLNTAPRVEEELRDAEGRGATTIVLDLRELRFMDSTGLRLVIDADARARESGGRLLIVRGPDTVQRVFRVTRLEERLDMIDEPPRSPADGAGDGASP